MDQQKTALASGLLALLLGSHALMANNGDGWKVAIIDSGVMDNHPPRGLTVD